MLAFPHRKELELVWHGGEPLIRGLDFYSRAVMFAKKTSEPELKIIHCLQTNGTLINKNWAEFFKQNTFKVGVSLDGPEALHNQFRRYKNGNGSFADVMRGIELLASQNVKYGMVTVVSSANIDCPDEIFQLAKDLKVEKLQISPCVEVGKGKAPFTVSPKKFGLFMCRLYDLWIEENNPDLSIGYLEDVVDVLLGRECNNCILGDHCHNFMVFDWNGQLSPCEDLFARHESFGNIKTTSLRSVLDSGARRGFYQRISEQKVKSCGHCEWFEMCKGGCPYQWKSFKSGKTHLCLGNKILFEHVSQSIEKMYSQISN